MSGVVLAGPVLPESWCRWGASGLSALTGGRFFSAWQLDAFAVIAVVVLAVPYLLLTRSLTRAAGRSGTRWPRRWTAFFVAGLAVIVLATCSSVGVYEMTLFSVHMIQHLMLIMIAPPLLVAGRPLTLLRESVGDRGRDRIDRAVRTPVVAAITSPPAALGAYALVIVVTHLTGLMDTIMRHAWAGQVEHAAYVLVGCQFFVLVFGDEPIRWRLSMPGRMLMLALSMAIDTFTGLVLLQGTMPIAMTPHPGWGASPLSDTRTGGAIMWFGGDGLMALLAVVLLWVWTRNPDQGLLAGSWAERARTAAFAEHTGYVAPAVPVAAAGAPGPTEDEIEDDDARLAAYNAWLAKLNAGGGATRR